MREGHVIHWEVAALSSVGVVAIKGEAALRLSVAIGSLLPVSWEATYSESSADQAVRGR